MRKVVWLGVLPLLVLACRTSLATPTKVIEVPTATVVGNEQSEVSLETQYDLATRTFRPLVGWTYGASEDCELGLDLIANDPQTLYLNMKYRLTDAGKETQFAVGLWGVGPRLMDSPNIIYAMATIAGKKDESKDVGTEGKTEGEEPSFKFHIGGYYGNPRYFGSNPASILAGCDFGGDLWRGYVDYFGGNNPRGMLSVGVGYTNAAREWSALLAYQRLNVTGASAVTLQLKYYTQ